MKLKELTLAQPSVVIGEQKAKLTVKYNDFRAIRSQKNKVVFGPTARDRHYPPRCSKFSLSHHVFPMHNIQHKHLTDMIPHYVKTPFVSIGCHIRN